MEFTIFLTEANHYNFATEPPKIKFKSRIIFTIKVSLQVSKVVNPRDRQNFCLKGPSWVFFGLGYRTIIPTTKQPLKLECHFCPCDDQVRISKDTKRKTAISPLTKTKRHVREKTKFETMDRRDTLTFPLEEDASHLRKPRQRQDLQDGFPARSIPGHSQISFQIALS